MHHTLRCARVQSNCDEIGDRDQIDEPTRVELNTTTRIMSYQSFPSLGKVAAHTY